MSVVDVQCLCASACRPSTPPGTPPTSCGRTAFANACNAAARSLIRGSGSTQPNSSPVAGTICLASKCPGSNNSNNNCMVHP